MLERASAVFASPWLLATVGGAYLLVLAVLATYGLHRTYLLVKRARLADRLRELGRGVPPIAASQLASDGERLPVVTIQLPLYNEASVATRLVRTVAAIEWPRDRLEIQVLDDSTDETPELVGPLVDDLRKQGIDAVHLRRRVRVGYKAGALDEGLAQARGDLIAMFDADFVPPADFLRRLVPHFADPKVGMVQARWGHLNREHSYLTQVAALMLDGHHVIENRVRAAAGWLFNFAGTGGIWRKTAIVDAGGWQHDTLTEDLDLSYRAQLAGWKFVYREDVVVPAELPEDVAAFRAQQHRWAKGTVQTRRKLLARLLRAELSFGARVEAFFHLTPHIAYPLTLLLGLLLLPTVLLLRDAGFAVSALWDLPLVLGTTGSLAAFYAASQIDQGRRAWDGLRHVPALLAVGIGLTPLVTRAFFEGQRTMAGEFVRTPKRGSEKARYRAMPAGWPKFELALALYSTATVVATVWCGHYFATPFACLFASGYWTMAAAMMRASLGDRAPDVAASPRLVAQETIRT